MELGFPVTCETLIITKCYDNISNYKGHIIYAFSVFRLTMLKLIRFPFEEHIDSNILDIYSIYLRDRKWIFKYLFMKRNYSFLTELKIKFVMKFHSLVTIFWSIGKLLEKIWNIFWSRTKVDWMSQYVKLSNIQMNWSVYLKDNCSVQKVLAHLAPIV